MDVLIGLIVLLLLGVPIAAIVALVKAVALGAQVRGLEFRLAALERAVSAAATAGPTAQTSSPSPQPAAGPIAPEPKRAKQEPAEQEPAAPPPAPEPKPAPAATSPIAPEPAAPRAQAAPAAPAMSFEERLGTQWAVWVGGLALALGGVFLVRYSIEQEIGRAHV